MNVVYKKSIIFKILLPFYVTPLPRRAHSQGWGKAAWRSSVFDFAAPIEVGSKVALQSGCKRNKKLKFSWPTMVFAKRRPAKLCPAREIQI